MTQFLANIGVIGGADGPTAIFITEPSPWLIPVLGGLIMGLMLYIILRRKR